MGLLLQREYNGKWALNINEKGHSLKKNEQSS